MKGIGFSGLLTIVFIVLKLTGHIDWSWWLVLAPAWVSFIVGVLIVWGVGELKIKAAKKEFERKHGFKLN